MSPRLRVIAAQAVLVSVLVVVVVVTLLRPQGPESLLGIDVPGAPGGAVTTPTPGSNEDNDQDDDEDEDDGEGGGGTGPHAGAAGGGTQAGQTIVPGAAVPLTAAPPADTGTGESSPANDQYADMLEKLSARLY
jgi:hypothetical protein